MGADEAEVAASVVVGTYYIVRKMVGHLVSHGCRKEHNEVVHLEYMQYAAQVTPFLPLQ